MVRKLLGTALVLSMVLSATPVAFSAENSSALASTGEASTFVIKMKHWSNSSQSEKTAFLAGIVSMIDLEKEWQAQKPLSLARSLTTGWVLGLGNMTLDQIQQDIDNYAAANPDQGETPVLEVLWMMKVQPKLSDAMKSELKKTYYSTTFSQKK